MRKVSRPASTGAASRGFKPIVEPLEDRRLFATVPAGFATTPFTSGLTRPSAMAFAPDGRLFVCEQGQAGVANLRVIENGVLVAKPALSLSVDSEGERGLIGITFDPNFTANGYIYLTYSAPSDAGTHNRVSRFTLVGDVADPASENVVFDLDPLGSAPVHNGGALGFGLDGKLYITSGDNGQDAKAQTLDNTFGKVLRVNADGSIPDDNPFAATTEGKYKAIWAYGLRNPYTVAFQPGTGRMFINDVGFNSFEEVNEGMPGANYGWPLIEGPLVGERPEPANYVDPLYAYSHNGAGAAIVGGAFYNPPADAETFPADYVGDYFFGELVQSRIDRLDLASGVVTASNFLSGPGEGINVTDVDVGPDGALYYLTYGTSAKPGSGKVSVVRYIGERAPRVTRVQVGSSQWTDAFRAAVGGNGYAVPAGEHQLDPLPWSNLNQISVTFDLPMSQAALQVARPSLEGEKSNLVALTFVNYDLARGVATWAVPEGTSLSADRWRFKLNDNVAAVNGAKLDGEWVDGASHFPSGDGAAGGKFDFGFNVLPGDVNQSAGAVNASDLVNVRNRVGQVAGGAPTPTISYAPRFDVNGDAVINAADLVIVRNAIGTILPDLVPVRFSVQPIRFAALLSDDLLSRDAQRT